MFEAMASPRRCGMGLQSVLRQMERTMGVKIKSRQAILLMTMISGRENFVRKAKLLRKRVGIML